MSDVVVFGSMNVDVTVRVRELPGPGQTVLASPATFSCGGKGGNQAAAAARLLGDRGRVRMIGLVGADDYGATLVADLRAHGVDTSEVATVPDVATGMAMICVDDAGENLIIVSPGANDVWREDLVDGVPVRAGDVVVCQLEVPLAAVAHMVDLASERGARVVLNAAPPQGIPPAVLAAVAVLVLNESEAAHVLGAAPASAADLERLTQGLACDVVVTCGAEGALVRPAGDPASHVASFEVRAVSAVGAGDAFVGALAVEMLRGTELVAAVRRACAAGALAASAAGARGGIPTATELDAFLEGASC